MSVLSDMSNDDLEEIYYAASGLFPNSFDGLRAVAEAAVQAEREAAVPEPFRVGNTYRTEGGKLVTFVSVHREGTSYETMADEDGVHRYTRRDFGRVTGAARDDYAVAPLYAHPPQASATAPDGWKLVPVVPTEEMLIASMRGVDYGTGVGLEHKKKLSSRQWKAMLAAAPSRPGDGEAQP